MQKSKNFGKLAIFLGFFLVFSLVLTGCGKQQDQTQTNNNRGSRIPDFGQPERQADISGLVKSITGNEVTIIKIDRPEMGQMNQEEGTSDEGAAEEGSTALGMGSGGSGMMGGGPGMGGGRPGEMDSEDDRESMLEQIKAMSSGEELVTIPVGIQMLKQDTSSDSKEPQMVEASLSDITADTMITIWLDESVTERSVASFVLINQ